MKIQLTCDDLPLCSVGKDGFVKSLNKDNGHVQWNSKICIKINEKEMEGKNRRNIQKWIKKTKTAIAVPQIV